MRASLWGCLSFAVLLASQTASAQNDAEEARRLFREGMTSLNDGLFADAISSFERSLRLQEAPATLYNVALAYRGTSQCTFGLNALDRFDALVTDPARRQSADDLRRQFDGCVVTVSLSVQGQCEALFIDGHPSPLRDGHHRILLDPGSHRFEVRRVGYRSVERVQEMQRGHGYEMALDASLDPLPAELIVDPGRADAAVRVDDVAMVEVPGAISTRPGPHRIRVVYPDGTSQERSVVVEPGGHLVVNFRERMAPPSQALWNRWWFWTGLGVVVAGAAVATVVALQPAPESRPPATWGTTEFSLRISP